MTTSHDLVQIPQGPRGLERLARDVNEALRTLSEKISQIYRIGDRDHDLGQGMFLARVVIDTYIGDGTAFKKATLPSRPKYVRIWSRPGDLGNEAVRLYEALDIWKNIGNLIMSGDNMGNDAITHDVTRPIIIKDDGFIVEAPEFGGVYLSPNVNGVHYDYLAIL